MFGAVYVLILVSFRLDEGFSHRDIEEERRILSLENPVTTTIDPLEKELLEWDSWRKQQPERVYIGNYQGMHEIDEPLSSRYDYFGGHARGVVSMGPSISWRMVLKIFGGGICCVLTFYLLCFWRRKLKVVRIARLLRVHKQTAVWHNITPMLPNTDASGWVRSSTSRSLTVVNNRTLHVDSSETTDIAVWDRGFSTGKHVFAILWPRDQRVFYGARICIGIGFHSELPGGDRDSVGLDLVENSILYDGYSIRTYPRGWNFVIPSLVYMYVDLDDDMLSFGSSEEYWGPAVDLSEVRRRKAREDPVQLIAAFKKVKGRFCLFYKGQVPDACLARSVDTLTGPATVEVAEASNTPSAHYSAGIINPAVDADAVDIRF